MRDYPNIERVRKALAYEPDTGILRWKIGVHRGKPAGSFCRGGYIKLIIGGVGVRAHHVAWALTHGVWPERLDHKNEIRHDNRISNLRPCSQSQNLCNRGKQRNNSSGFKGVSWSKGRNRYQATIQKNYKIFHLGFFDDPQEAAHAYRAAALMHHGEFAHA